MKDNTAIVPHGSTALSEWGGAADRGLKAREERQNIIRRVLKDGPDFGTIPGTPKPTLLKPGAEKIADCLNLYPDYDPIQVIEDFDKPLFFYRYRCILRQRGSDAVIATGIGSCNSMEDRYRWRKAERVCPSCGKAAIIKGKAEYGGGFICFKKKDGCGAKFKEDDQAITSQEAGKMPNPDLHSQVNTIDKMAQKRALVAAALNLGFSEQFTQDLEDVPEEEREIPATVTKTDAPKSKPKPEDVISETDRRLLWGRWQARIKELGLPEKEAEARLKAVLLKFGYDSTKKVCNGDLDKILDAIETYEVPDAA